MEEFYLKTLKPKISYGLKAFNKITVVFEHSLH